MNPKAILTTVFMSAIAVGSLDTAYAGSLENCTAFSADAMSGAIVAEGRTTNNRTRVREEVLATADSGVIDLAGCIEPVTQVCVNGACGATGPTGTAEPLCEADPAWFFVGKETTGLTDFDCDSVGPILDCSANQSPRYVVRTNEAAVENEPLIGNVVAVGFDLRGVLPPNSVQNPPTDQDFVDIYSENAVHPQTKVFENCEWVP